MSTGSGRTDKPSDGKPTSGTPPAAKPAVARLTVSPQESGEKLLHFLERKRPGVPRSALMRVIRTGEVRVNGGRAKPFDLLETGAEVRVPPLAIVDGANAPARPLPILFEGLGLMVIDKPPGLASQPGTGLTDSVTDRLKGLHADREFAPQIVHRLDREASGLLLAGTTHASVRRLNALFRDKTESARRGGSGSHDPLEKVYLAWVDGRLRTPREGVEVRDRLERVRTAGEHAARASDRASGGKEAVARVLAILTVKLEGGRECTLVAVRLGTGRLHQIRAQLGLRGHPLIGDATYGGPRLSEVAKPARNSARILLHAWRAQLPEVCFFSEPDWPEPFAIGPEERARLAAPPATTTAPATPESRQTPSPNKAEKTKRPGGPPGLSRCANRPPKKLVKGSRRG